MATAMEICLEELDTNSDEPFIRCVALPGGEPGLALDRRGSVRWAPEVPADYGLWVSADGRLALLRREGAAPLTVQRAGRSLEAPAEKPVLLLDQDVLVVGGRRLRVHVHGEAQVLHEPERLSRSALAKLARAAAAALALGAAAGASAEPAPPIEVRQRPPVVAPTRTVSCDVEEIKAQKQGPVLVHARCPANSRVPVGTLGQLLAADGKEIAEGTATVKQVAGDRLVCETLLKKPVKATRVVFRVR